MIRYIRFSTFLFLMLAGLMPAGCAHVSDMPSPLPSYIQKIYLPIFENETIQYGLEEKITNLLIEELLKDERLEISSQEKACQAVLKGKAVYYQRTPLTYDQNGRITRYKISIKVVFSLHDLVSNQVLFQGQQEEITTYTPEESEDAAIEKALANIAHYIAKSIIR